MAKDICLPSASLQDQSWYQLHALRQIWQRYFEGSPIRNGPEDGSVIKVPKAIMSLSMIFNVNYVLRRFWPISEREGNYHASWHGTFPLFIVSFSSHTSNCTPVKYQQTNMLRKKK